MHFRIIRTDRTNSTSRSAFALSLIASAMLAACGGGGSDGTSAGATSLDDSTITAYSADAAQMGSDATTAADTAALSAQLVIASMPTVAPASTPDAAALGAPSPDMHALATTVSRTIDCAGGGSVALTATGASLETLGNGKLDVGEIYHLAFTACSGAAGYAALDGTLDMTVDAASGDTSNGTLGITMTATALSATLPHGKATLDGTATRTLTAVTGGDSVTHLTSHYVSPSWTLATQYNARSATFALTSVDITRMAAISGGVIQSTSISGSHSLSASTPNGSFSYSVATTGGATYGADGKPAVGNWTITLPDSIITVALLNGTATITLDRGKDGTIDRTIVITRDQMFASAG